ncbi:pilus assembly protein PilM [Paenalkalicoccus suaedae]|uniref:Pilus assembly protein PilM n=1 Tax=Paenalkalicoccus suaedae TaxID=2592382 RepID=A0A859FI04_9BACI|nr:pilus assembly protein PilM [Paenalkalicoccus suaedae]QKS71855.1 pilus assembly protein PilM [Paenalkalicoccus suaedae]
MNPFTNTTRHALIIHDHVIRFVKAKRSSLREIELMEERFIPQGVLQNGRIVELDTFATILQEITDEWKLRKKKVMFTIPDSMAVIRRHQVPITVHQDEIRSHLYMELGESLHLPIEQPVFHAHEISANEETRDMLIFAAPEENVVMISKLLKEVHIKPVVADLVNLSLFRFYELMGFREEEHMMMLQVYPTHVHATIFDHELPLVMRTIPLESNSDKWKLDYGELRFTGESEELLSGWRDAEDEIGKLLNFYQYNYQSGQSSVGKIVVSGDHPLLEKLTELAKQTFTQKVVGLFELEAETKRQERIEARFYEAVGLAMKKEV